MTRQMLSRLTSSSLAAVFALSLANGPATAQQRKQMSDGMISVQAQMPQTVRASEQFTYQVTVTNTTDNVTLHDIKLRQSKAKGFTIEGVSQEGSRQNSGGQSKQQSGSQSNQDNQKQGQQKKQKQGQKQDSGGKNSSSQKDGSGAQQNVMTVKKLEPGQSQRLQVKAAADQKGQLKTCLRIVSYKPSLCLTSKVVRPELQLTKVAPNKVNRCEIIELTYGVKNSGSGQLGAFVIQDDLADGLRTIEGKKTLEFKVDGGLESGEVREFVADVYATKTGQFSSRAVAKATQSDLKARSESASTTVVAPDLTAKVSGGGTSYGDQPIAFTARITNSGKADADQVDVQLSWPQDAQLVEVSDPQRVQASQNKSSKADQSGQSKQQQSDGKDQSKGENQSQKQGQSQDQGQNQEQERGQNSKQRTMDSRSLTIDGLKQGESVEFRYVVRPNGMSKVPTKVEAVHVCQIAELQDQERAKAKMTATASGSADVVRIPALQLYALDKTDPIASGGDVAYTIRVRNEGNATDNQIEITANLPEGFEFKSADGPTKAQSKGSTVSFQPIKKLEAGDEVEYTLTAKASGEGDKELQVKLESDALDETVEVAEPTRVYQGQAQN